MGRWTKQEDGSMKFTPVTVAGETLMERIAVVADPASGTTHLALIGKYGDATTIQLRPTDAARIGKALIESSVIAEAL